MAPSLTLHLHPLLLLSLLLSFREIIVAISIGVNWGSIATHQLPPSTIVQVLLDNNFNKVKIFDSNPRTLSALSSTSIVVTVAIPNFMLLDLSSDPQLALQWVRDNLHPFPSLNIKYVAVGNEPFLKSYNGSYTHTTLPALRNVQQALLASKLTSHIKAIVPFNADIYFSSSPDSFPSAGDFRPDIRDVATDILQHLALHNAPFVVNIYPFLSVYSDPHFPMEFAFFEQDVGVVDGGNNYTNVFDANFDTLVWALTKAGFPDMPIVIGEIGWPTDGDKNANVGYAEKFNQRLVDHLASGAGTPMRRGGEIEVYLFSLMDEDAKSIAPGDFERHWGIFEYDGRPKYELDLSGRGRKRNLVGPRRVEYLERRWCVLGDVEVEEWEVRESVEFACSHSDCTALGYGSSCNHLGVRGNASYAFNMYYQVKGQGKGECDFEGLGVVTEVDPSDERCRFPVMIASGRVLKRGVWLWITMVMVVMMVVRDLIV